MKNKHLYTVNFKVDREHIYNLQFINETARYNIKDFKELCLQILEDELIEVKGHSPTANIRTSETLFKMKGFIACLSDRGFVLLSSINIDIDGYTFIIEDNTKYDTKPVIERKKRGKNRR